MLAIFKAIFLRKYVKIGCSSQNFKAAPGELTPKNEYNFNKLILLKGQWQETFMLDKN